MIKHLRNGFSWPYGVDNGLIENIENHTCVVCVVASSFSVESLLAVKLSRLLHCTSGPFEAPRGRDTQSKARARYVYTIQTIHINVHRHNIHITYYNIYMLSNVYDTYASPKTAADPLTQINNADPSMSIAYETKERGCCRRSRIPVDWIHAGYPCLTFKTTNFWAAFARGTITQLKQQRLCNSLICF